ncbi:hypothetical protein LC612_40370 [Nostoc sp. CHAB 5834]|nr:hypothetical protein [Nostoc sp. CHAB 5834]
MTVYEQVMMTKEHTAEQPLLLNKHLKEWNENLVSEKEALYLLRSKHGLARDELSFERVTDPHRRIQLLTQQAGEVDQLKQQANEIRLTLLERQAKEKNNLKRVS